MTRRLELPWLRALAVLGIAAAAALAIAACGGSSDTATNGGSSSSSAAGGGGGPRPRSRWSATRRPKKAYDALTTAFAATPQGKGVSLQPVVRRLRLAEPRRRLRSAGRRRRLLDHAGHDAAGQGQHRRQRLGRQPREGHVQRLGRRVRGPQGQPQAHHRLGRPDQARAST